ncbi:MAG: hypothetical protein VB912_09255 [Pirellulaceae bacterium]
MMPMSVGTTTLDVSKEIVRFEFFYLCLPAERDSEDLQSVINQAAGFDRAG